MDSTTKIVYLGDGKTNTALQQAVSEKYKLPCQITFISSRHDLTSALSLGEVEMILCDQDLSLMSLEEALALNKTSANRLPFVLIAKSLSEERIIHLMKQGMDDWVSLDHLENLPHTITTHLLRKRALKKDETASEFEFDRQDLTSKLLVEDLLQKSEANLKTIFNNTHISYVLSDKKFNVISFNKSAISIYKKEFRVELKEGDNLLDYLPEERKEVSRNRFERALRGDTVNYELNFRQPDGNFSWYNVNMFAIRDKLNMLLGFVISSEDITERKTIELDRIQMITEIVQHNKDLEQFSYIISHNLRSPVANIIGLSNVIKSPDLNKEDFNKCIDGLTLSAAKLDEIIVDLNFILQKRRQIDEKKETVNFSNLLNDIKTILSQLIAKENIVINTDFKTNTFFTVKSYVHSIFLNLITNSIKYRNPARANIIDIACERKNNKLVLTFKDNGLGIDLESFGNKVFGLYEKFHIHTVGKGIGLYLVKTQVEILGGKIEVKSDVDVGTTFIIHFDDVM